MDFYFKIENCHYVRNATTDFADFFGDLSSEVNCYGVYNLFELYWRIQEELLRMSLSVS